MVSGVNGITSVIQSYLENTKKNTVSNVAGSQKSFSLDSYLQTPYVPDITYRSDYNVGNYFGEGTPRDSFEEKLTEEDAGYFHYLFSTGGAYVRVPGTYASTQVKEEWLVYAKEMAQYGFTPDDLYLMSDGGTNDAIIWIPPKNASIEVKKAWCETVRDLQDQGGFYGGGNALYSARKMFYEALGIEWGVVHSVEEGRARFISMSAYVNKKLSGLTVSYADIFSKMLDNLKEKALTSPVKVDMAEYNRLEDWIISSRDKFSDN